MIYEYKEDIYGHHIRLRIIQISTNKSLMFCKKNLMKFLGPRNLSTLMYKVITLYIFYITQTYFLYIYIYYYTFIEIHIMQFIFMYMQNICMCCMCFRSAIG